MMGNPEMLQVDELRKDIMFVGGGTILDIHGLSVNTIGKTSVSLHIITSEPQKSLTAVTELCRSKYRIQETTI